MSLNRRHPLGLRVRRSSELFMEGRILSPKAYPNSSNNTEMSLQCTSLPLGERFD
jgi:hypothetical protein